ncbi:MAG: hypothetical protein N2688_01770 [Burkholderiaceae bacterium]|jgi:hypothetical protein|nr:hypothetical protein [Burkholderiaceae bacterium]
MATTSRLGITLLEQGQAQAHVTVNEALQQIDDVCAGRTAVNVTAGGTITLTAAQTVVRQINLYGSPSAGYIVQFPARTGDWIVVNDTGANCTFRPVGGAGQVVPAYCAAHLICDGTNVVDARSVLTQNVVINEGKALQFGTVTGSRIGTDPAEKLGFWGATPIVRPASANQAAVTQTAGATYTTTERDMLNALKTLVNQLRADLVAAGLIKGSA